MEAWSEITKEVESTTAGDTGNGVIREGHLEELRTAELIVRMREGGHKEAENNECFHGGLVCKPMATGESES